MLLKKVGEGFNCDFNSLTNLVGAPTTVVGDFHCVGNPLTSLEGLPKTITGSLFLSATLKGEFKRELSNSTIGKKIVYIKSEENHRSEYDGEEDDGEEDDEEYDDEEEDEEEDN